MSETVQMALLTFLGIALGILGTSVPQWAKAKSEARRAKADTEAVTKSAAELVNNSTWERVKQDQDRAEKRDIAREKQLDALRAELLQERAQRYTEQNLQSATLADERNQRRVLASQIENERTNRAAEIEAIRSSSGETIANLTKQVAELKVTINELKDTINGLQLRLDQEHDGRLAAEKRVEGAESRVAELELQIARLLDAGIAKASAPPAGTAVLMPGTTAQATLEISTSKVKK